MKNHPFLEVGAPGESCNPNRLYSQTLAALGAASSQDSAASTGLGADQKTVGTFAARGRGLISTLHDAVFLFETEINGEFDNICTSLVNR
jgi:hypothetical protein